jgi:hypothetical protein
VICIGLLGGDDGGPRSGAICGAKRSGPPAINDSILVPEVFDHALAVDRSPGRLPNEVDS